MVICRNIIYPILNFRRTVYVNILSYYTSNFRHLYIFSLNALKSVSYFTGKGGSTSVSWKVQIYMFGEC